MSPQTTTTKKWRRLDQCPATAPSQTYDSVRDFTVHAWSIHIRKYLITSSLYQFYYPVMSFDTICALFMQNMTSNVLTSSVSSETDKPLNGHSPETDTKKVSHLPLLLSSHWLELSAYALCVCCWFGPIEGIVC